MGDDDDDCQWQADYHRAESVCRADEDATILMMMTMMDDGEYGC